MRLLLVAARTVPPEPSDCADLGPVGFVAPWPELRHPCTPGLALPGFMRRMGVPSALLILPLGLGAVSGKSNANEDGGGSHSRGSGSRGRTGRSSSSGPSPVRPLLTSMRSSAGSIASRSRRVAHRIRVLTEQAGLAKLNPFEAKYAQRYPSHRVVLAQQLGTVRPVFDFPAQSRCTPPIITP